MLLEAWVAERRNEPGTAEDAYRRALALARRIGFADHASFALAQLGSNPLARGDTYQAEELCRRALAMAEAASGPWLAAHARVQLARVQERAGDTDTAETLYRRVVEWSQTPRPRQVRESLFVGLAGSPGRRRCGAWRGLQQPADTTTRPRTYRPAPPWSRSATAPRPMRYKGQRQAAAFRSSDQAQLAHDRGDGLRAARRVAPRGGPNSKARGYGETPHATAGTAWSLISRGTPRQRGRRSWQSPGSTLAAERRSVVVVSEPCPLWVPAHARKSAVAARRRRCFLPPPARTLRGAAAPTPSPTNDGPPETSDINSPPGVRDLSVRAPQPRRGQLRPPRLARDRRHLDTASGRAGKALFVSGSTVRKHLEHIFDKRMRPATGPVWRSTRDCWSACAGARHGGDPAARRVAMLSHPCDRGGRTARVSPTKERAAGCEGIATSVGWSCRPSGAG
jgi:hypothetical protein